MTDRDRLIELIRQGKDMTPCENNSNYNCKGIKCEDCESQSIADYLLANGVIVPPCNVGETVYLPRLNDWGDIKKYTITKFVLDKDGLCFVVDDKDRKEHSIEILGKEVFLAKDEAEKARSGIAMAIKQYRVVKTDFNDLEDLLNKVANGELYPHYHIYQILPEHCHGGAWTVVILELD